MCTLHLQWSSSAPWVFELAFDHQPVRLATKDLACCDSQKLGGSRNKWSSPGDKLPIKKTPTVKNHWDLTLIGWGRGTWCWKKKRSTLHLGLDGIVAFFIRYSLSLAPSFFWSCGYDNPWRHIILWKPKEELPQNPERIATVSYHTKSWFLSFR